MKSARDDAAIETRLSTGGSGSDRERWLQGWPRLVRTLGTAADTDELFQQVCEAVVEGFGFSRALIATVNAKRHSLVARAGYDPNLSTQLYMALFRLFQIPLSPEPDGRLLVAAWCVARGQQAHVPDASRDSFRPDEATQRPFLIKALGTREYVVTPIVYRGRTVAILGVDKKGQAGGITSDEQALLRDLADLLALRLGPLLEAETAAPAGRGTVSSPTGLEGPGVIRALLDGLDQALLVVGPEQRVRFANRAAAALLNADVREINGRDLGELLPVSGSESFLHHVTTAAEKSRSLKKQERLFRGTSMEQEVQIRVLPLLPDLDAQAILIQPGGDHAEDRRLPDEAFHSMLHDLLAPIQSIVGFAELLQMGRLGPLQPDQAEFVSRIVAGGDELIEFIDRLLTMRRLEARAPEARWESISTPALIDRVLERLRGKALRAQVRLTNEIAGEPTCLWGDAFHLTALFQNLVDNAVEATPAGGTVRVTGTGHGDGRYARFTVSQETADQACDSPRGLRAASLSDGSCRGAGWRRRSHGLGLAIVRRVVETHGGELWAEGELESDLSITFTLPLKR
jgi:signal transduction histidine kinase